jgi:hypothetical protein
MSRVEFELNEQPLIAFCNHERKCRSDNSEGECFFTVEAIENKEGDDVMEEIQEEAIQSEVDLNDLIFDEYKQQSLTSF